MEEFITRASSLHNGLYDYDKVIYNNMHTKVLVKCKIHGTFLISPAKHVYRKQGCPSCAKKNNKGNTGTRKYSAAQWVERFKAVHGELYDYSNIIDVYSRIKLPIMCREHGVFMQDAANHLKGKGCPVCKPSIASLPKAVIPQGAVREGDKVIRVCDKHGEYKTHLSNLPKGCGCSKCRKRDSSEQRYIQSYIEASDVHVIPNVTGILTNKKKELDLYLKDLNIAIEVNGIWHHSTGSQSNKRLSSISDIRSREVYKHNECTKKGIRLLTFLDSEIKDRSSAVLNILNGILGTLDYRQARKCILKTISSKEHKEFMDKYHIQGACRVDVAYGLYYNDELISCMSFRCAKGVWEIARYVTIAKVVGGASKLFSRFIKEKSPSKVISFCHDRLFSGDIYKRLGFNVDTKTSYDYRFFYKGHDYHRRHFTKKKLKLNTPITDAVLASLGIYKIFLPGMTKYSMEIA